MREKGILLIFCVYTIGAVMPRCPDPGRGAQRLKARDVTESRTDAQNSRDIVTIADPGQVHNRLTAHSHPGNVRNRRDDDEASIDSLGGEIYGNREVARLIDSAWIVNELK